MQPQAFVKFLNKLPILGELNLTKSVAKCLQMYQPASLMKLKDSKINLLLAVESLMAKAFKDHPLDCQLKDGLSLVNSNFSCFVGKRLEYAYIVI
jgi:hypothetical protein